MKLTKTLSIAIVLSLLTIGCDEDEKQNTIPSTASLVSPSNNITIVGLDTDLTWNESIDPNGGIVKYDVYLSTEEIPATTVATDIETVTLEVSDLTNNATYYWKVVAKNKTEESVTSETWSFNTNAILGDWVSDPTEIMPDITIVQSFTFNNDGTGSIQQTGDLTNSFTMSWHTSGSTLTMNVNGVGDDTVYHTFENNGNSMIFKESEMTPNVTMKLNRKEN